MTKSDAEQIEDETRETLLHDMDNNILVEAGAGSGKTTMLVSRMIEQIKKTDIHMSELVAITFTNKAAEELKGRFQNELIKAYMDERDTDAKRKLREAVDTIDDINISTIHSFCGVMLKEMPFEAGLSPDFKIIEDDGLETLQRNVFSSYCLTADTAKLQEIDLTSELLYTPFKRICEIDDAEWAYDKDVLDDLKAECSDIYSKSLECLRKIDIDYIAKNFNEPEIKNLGIGTGKKGVLEDIARDIHHYIKNGPGADINTVKLLKYIKLNEGKKGDISVGICRGSTTDKNGEFDQNQLLKAYKMYSDLKTDKVGVTIMDLQERWKKIRHAAAMDFIIKAVTEYKEYKKKMNILTNDDILKKTQRLLYDSQTARDYFRSKYKFFYVDEFQDTDPIQTDILFSLTATDETVNENELEKRMLNRASICLIGDPKQSIYRFRGADITLYNRVKSIFEDRSSDYCKVYRLNRNFRSGEEICDWVESKFLNNTDIYQKLMELGDDKLQAAMNEFHGILCRPNEPKKDDTHISGIYDYDIYRSSGYLKDAECVSSIIRNLTEQKYSLNIPEGGKWIDKEITYGDFLILVWKNDDSQRYAAELKKYDIPVSVAGNIRMSSIHEVDNLFSMVDYLSDHGNTLKLCTVLEALFGIEIEAPERVTLTALIWDEDKIKASGYNENLKNALLKICSYLKMTVSSSPLLILDRLIDDFSMIMADREYSAGDIKYAMESLKQTAEMLRSLPIGTMDDLCRELDRIRSGQVDRVMPISSLYEKGSCNAVRIMNLHKAKGLEGNIVILASPSDSVRSLADDVVIRDGKGYVSVSVRYPGIDMSIPIGASEGMKQYAEETKKAGDNERCRLHYVACTRAARVLIVSKDSGLRGPSCWKAISDMISPMSTGREYEKIIEQVSQYRKTANEENEDHEAVSSDEK